MTTEEMNTLDRQVAELMGIEMAYEDVEGRLVMAHDEIMYWQPTRDPRCERIVMEWLLKKNLMVRVTYCSHGCTVFIQQTPSVYTQKESPYPGIALCLAVVETFGGKNETRASDASRSVPR